jgi:hypothetical protein
MTYRDELKVDEGLEREPPELLHVLLVGDAEHERREDEREHDELDRAKENVLHRRRVGREVGGERSQDDAETRAKHDPERQRREDGADQRLLGRSLHGLVGVCGRRDRHGGARRELGGLRARRQVGN